MRVLTYSRVAALGRRTRRKGKPPTVRIHKRVERSCPPKVSVILLDWSCRERFHTLRWLAHQDVPRAAYELIWIELYDRVVQPALEYCDVVATCNQRGMYHKHIAYNLGILTARGDVVTICDSDAVYPRDFIRSILRSFFPENRTEPVPLVLMHHELRTSYQYPEDLRDAEELKQKRPGHWEWWDIVPNAGACMSVAKRDAIRFGGFDEHPAYRGYLCGPYELGWRLVNAGLPEVWHDMSTVIWHFAHPDPAGVNGIRPTLRRLLENRYPHADMHAILAVEAFSSGRVLPLRENSEIFERRMRDRRIGTPFEERFARLTGPQGFPRWGLKLLRLSMILEILWAGAAEPVLRRLGRAVRWCVGNRMYSVLRRLYPFGSSPVPQREIPQIVGEREGFNIVRYAGRYWGVPKPLGPVNLAVSDPPAEVLVARTRRGVERLIREKGAPAVVPYVFGRQGSYNLIEYKDRFYAVPLALGPVDLDASHLDPAIVVRDSREALADWLARNARFGDP